MEIAMESLWSFAVMLLNSLHEAVVAVLLCKELKKDCSGGGRGGSRLILDCIVCLNHVFPGEEYGNLSNCSHGHQFHSHCMEAWLKNHSTCPLCRSHIPRPFLQCIHAISLDYYHSFLSYLRSALDSVGKSI